LTQQKTPNLYTIFFRKKQFFNNKQIFESEKWGGGDKLVTTCNDRKAPVWPNLSCRFDHAEINKDTLF
jgi:hypothetical protein